MPRNHKLLLELKEEKKHIKEGLQDLMMRASAKLTKKGPEILPQTLPRASSGRDSSLKLERFKVRILNLEGTQQDDQQTREIKYK
uniref:Uncharacterized protein n=1 Tax=Nelumbo nucifera TaxID=4432 RepID=A0A822ZUJ6_NELNU|nr:TPA_asm: hypothetical protein HUJ06_018580 [Nelumbo nucifera]